MSSNKALISQKRGQTDFVFFSKSFWAKNDPPSPSHPSPPPPTTEENYTEKHGGGGWGDARKGKTFHGPTLSSTHDPILKWRWILLASGTFNTQGSRTFIQKSGMFNTHFHSCSSFLPFVKPPSRVYSTTLFPPELQAIGASPSLVIP